MTTDEVIHRRNHPRWNIADSEVCLKILLDAVYEVGCLETWIAATRHKVCCYCGTGPGQAGMHADHLIPRRVFPSRWARAKLVPTVPACALCNLTLGQYESTSVAERCRYLRLTLKDPSDRQIRYLEADGAMAFVRYGQADIEAFQELVSEEMVPDHLPSNRSTVRDDRALAVEMIDLVRAQVKR